VAYMLKELSLAFCIQLSLLSSFTNLTLISNFILVYLFRTRSGFNYYIFFADLFQLFIIFPSHYLCSVELHYTNLFVRLDFLSINRFERKKNLDLAISAFALLRSVASALPGDALQEATLTVAGNFCLKNSALSVAGSMLLHGKTADFLLCSFFRWL
jgi:glycosyltransferase involved in cell wall biosynthesis